MNGESLMRFYFASSVWRDEMSMVKKRSKPKDKLNKKNVNQSRFYGGDGNCFWVFALDN